MSLASTIMNQLRLRNPFFPISYANLFLESHTLQQYLTKYLVFFLLCMISNFNLKMQIVWSLWNRGYCFATTFWLLFSLFISLFFSVMTLAYSMCHMQYQSLCYINKIFFKVLLSVHSTLSMWRPLSCYNK